MDRTELKRLIARYCEAERGVLEARDEVFPVGAVVKYGVNHKQLCIVAASDECPPCMLPLMFENDNVWHKAIADVEPHYGVTPKWASKFKSKLK